MENKIKLIDIIEKPLELVENIIKDIRSTNGEKYKHLFNSMLNKVIHEEYPEIDQKAIFSIDSYDGLKPNIHIYSKNILEVAKMDLLNYLFFKTGDDSELANEFNFELKIEEKYKFTVNEVFDISDDIINSLRDSEEISLKFIYMIIMIFIKSEYIKKSRGLGVSAITTIEMSENKIWKTDKPFCAISAVWIYKMGLLKGRTYDFTIIRNFPSIIWEAKIRNQVLEITNNMDDHKVVIGMSNDFNSDKCLYMFLDLPNNNLNDLLIDPIYIDMQYISEELEKAFNEQLFKYKRIDKNVIDKPVSYRRLKETLENAVKLDKFKSLETEYIWSLLSFTLRDLYKPIKWYNLLDAYGSELIYYHKYKYRMYVKNLHKALHNENIDHAYDIIEKMNHSVITDGPDYYHKNINKFLMDVALYTLGLDLDNNSINESKNEVNSKLINSNIKDIILMNHKLTNLYVFNVLKFNGEWNLDIKGNTIEEITKELCNENVNLIQALISNITLAVTNLLEFQSRKTLFRVLVHAIKYIYNYTIFNHLHEPTGDDFKNVLYAVNKVELKNNILQFTTKKGIPNESFTLVNSIIDSYSFNIDDTTLKSYEALRAFKGRYADMGELYQVIKDILFIYICLIYSNYTGYDKNLLLGGLNINGCTTKWRNNDSLTVPTIDKICDSEPSSSAMQFTPMSIGGARVRDNEIRKLGYNPDTIPFIIKYKEDLTSDQLTYENITKCMNKFSTQNSEEKHEITHGEEYTVKSSVIDNNNDILTKIKDLLGHSMSYKLEDMWNKQEEFDKITFDINKTSRESTRRDRYLALMVELGEVLKEDECYKYWKNSRHTIETAEYKEKAKEEFADLMHFVMSIGIDLFDNVDELYEYFVKKHNINVERQLNNY